MFQKLQSLLQNLFSSRAAQLAQLEDRLRVERGTLSGKINLKYRWHKLKKQDGGKRIVYSPNPELKRIQRVLTKRLFASFKVHPCAKGFRQGESIVTHARLHQSSRVVIRIDLTDFFSSTKSDRLRQYLAHLGWHRTVIKRVVELTTKRHGESRSPGLPQGAPTSPILSNILNYEMDQRLAGLAKKSNAIYSRYADDLTFSFDRDDRRFLRGVVRRVKRIVSSYGYRINWKKLRVMRRHHPQIVTGLVVNEKVQLPRKLRRKLRSAEHHIKTGRPATYSQAEIQGWRAFQQMIDSQRVE